MDFIRTAIKTCFYYYPLSSVSKMIRDRQYDDFCSRIADLAKWVEPEFTLTEQKLLKSIVSEKWLKSSLGGVMKGSEMSRVFLILNHFSKRVLNDTSLPTVRFDNLLRWHDISLSLGENILICAYLAERDLLSGNVRKSFIWPDILSHDNVGLNIILDQGFSDVHAHFFASTDVFAENWLALMNHVAFEKKGCGQRHGIVDLCRPRQEGDVNFWGDQDPLTLHQWGIVAAAIRAQLVMCLFHKIPFDTKNIIRMLYDASMCISMIPEIIGDIMFLSDYALRMDNGRVLDYAINKNDIGELNKVDLTSPYMLHVGERRLLYCFFRRYYDMDKEAIKLAPFVYLYVLIKSKIRREFIQTNCLSGFENFKNYQDAKNLFSQYHVKSIYKYVVQTAIGERGKNCLEARVNSTMVNQIRHQDYNGSLFGGRDYFDHDVADNLRLVAHFIKSKERLDKDISHRHFRLRQSLYRQLGEVILDAQRNDYAIARKAPLLVGIDAAGSELNCRPEVFAPYFRWARLKGLTNMTFHAGEDFYDIIDGIRTIDETILFMQYQRGCRIGHGLALGIDPQKYYSRRHYRAIMPKQYMLDNCVWLKYKSKQFGIELSVKTVHFLEEHIHSLLSEIGYGENIDVFYYWQSMLLRGDARNSEGGLLFPAFTMATFCRDVICENARKYSMAKELHERYETDLSIRGKGCEPCEYKYPNSICEDVYAIQERMLTEIENKGIYIECNPSSNVKIGPFERYDELPLMRFFNLKPPYRHRINVSVNTDDRGVFSTSIHNEYSLVAIALSKALNQDGQRKYTNEEILEYIEQIIKNGHTQRFNQPEMKLC